jgi:hypothetical protein
MATFSFQVTGMEELFAKLKKAEDKALGVAAMGLYEGAGIVADAVSRGVREISTEPFKYAKNGQKRKPSPEEKAALSMAPSGVAKFRKKLNRVDTTVGYNMSGYVNVNFKHMRASARTNYKAVSFKGKESTASSTLKYLRSQKGSERYNISADIGKGAQNQKPVGVIANSINSGTSFMVKQPFMRKAFSKSKGAAEAAIEAGIMARLDELGIE